MLARPSSPPRPTWGDRLLVAGVYGGFAAWVLWALWWAFGPYVTLPR